MKKFGLIALLVLLGTYLNVVAFSEATHAGTFTAFGPKDYIRSKKKPVMVKDNFSVLNPHTSYTLHLYNGGKNNEFPQKVSRAAIRLNGIQVVRPKDFKQGVAHIEKPVRLSKNNRLLVILPSAPDSGMTIEIIGVDNDWPTINATLTPAPNAAGWNNTNVTVNFQCEDSTSGIASCSDPVVVETEGIGQIVTGYATDLAGNTGVLNFTVSVDKTPPSVVITEPSNGSILQNSPVDVTGTASDALSGIAAVTCNGNSVSLSNSIYSHEMPLAEGDNLITVEATDVAGNVGHSSITVAYGAPKLVGYQKENLVPNLTGQFLTLQHHGDALAFRRGEGDQPETSRHYQGLARSLGYGVPYLFITRNGSGEGLNTTDYPGELLVVKMESRNQLGERFASNRLSIDENLEDFAPPANDEGIKSIHFGIDNTWPRYTHIGSVQLIDDVLIVALEKFCPQNFNWDPDPAKRDCPVNIEKKGGIALIDVSNPENPQLITFKDFFTTSDDHGVGVVGATYIKPGQHSEFGGKYLFVLAWGSSDKLRFAIADTNDLHTATADSIQLLPGEWSEDALGDDKGKWRDWQTLQFFRDQYDNLYLLGADNVGVAGGKDWIALFKFDPAGLTSGGGLPTITYVTERHLRLGEPDMGVLDAASTFYVTPTGQLIFYSAPHTDKNTWDESNVLVKSVEMGEFRNIYVSFTGTCGPQWRGGLPSYHLGGPYHIQAYSIEEVERLTIDGRLYFIEPWVHMFEDTLTSFFDLFYMNLSGLGLMMDWGSQFLDNYNDLNNFKFTDADFKDRADAFIFCGTTDSILFLSAEPYFQPPRPDYPYYPPDMGPFTALAGTGSVLVEPDLRSYNDSDRHDDVESAYIYWQKPSGPEYVWGLGGDARGTIIQTDAPDIIEYQPACGTYTDTVYMRYYNRDEWKAETQITVEDTTPPIIDRLTTTPNVLWPPNHKLVPVSVSVSASDNCGGPVTCQIVSVNSNEVENGVGYGGKAPDWIIAGDLTLKLRAERSGTGDGRIYTITVNCADSSGNKTSGDVTVSVPHDKRKKK